MTPEERHYLEALKRRIAERSAGEGPVKPVEEWSVPDIERFREELQVTVQGSISEKWFYTHFKGKEQEKLPRIDTLNLLSHYLGYRDWEHFKAEHPYGSKAEQEGPRSSAGSLKKFAIPMILILTAGILSSIPLMQTDKEVHRVCFEDRDSGARLEEQQVTVKLQRKGESPLTLQSDSSACVELPVAGKKIRFIVEAPYYRTDTIVRRPKAKENEESIPLKKDDRALMIRSVSRPGEKDIQKHREQLQRMIADDARIFQVHGKKEKGVELYNKEEFIDKLTMPISSLEEIEVIHIRSGGNGKIQSIRFRQGSN